MIKLVMVMPLLDFFGSMQAKICLSREWSHAFQDKGGWYIENSLTTLGQKDPVSEENTRLWNTGVDSDKEIARKKKEKTFLLF